MPYKFWLAVPLTTKSFAKFMHPIRSMAQMKGVLSLLSPATTGSTK
jgi:hypothetical protein